MHTIKNNLAMLFIISFTLESCTFGASMPQQITSLNVSCNSDDVLISDNVVELNGEESWTAKCGGKIYYCNYLAESGSDCYELKE